MVEPYSIDVRPDARDELRALGKSNANRILKKIKWLSENLDAESHEALKGEFKELFKLHVGDYRVIYSIVPSKRLVTIHSVGHRRDIYESH